MIGCHKSTPTIGRSKALNARYALAQNEPVPLIPMKIFTVSVRIRRRSDAPPLPDFADPTAVPRRGRRHLSRDEFAARYGASEDDLAAIAAFAAANGLSVVETSIPRRTVVLKGTAAQMNKAFAVDLGTYESTDETYR